MATTTNIVYMLPAVWLRARFCCFRWSNIYSKHLLRVLYASEEDTGDSNGNASPGKNEGQGKRAPNEDFGKKPGSKTRRFDYSSSSTVVFVSMCFHDFALASLDFGKVRQLAG